MDRVTLGYEILVALIFKLQEDKFLNVSASELKKSWKYKLLIPKTQEVMTILPNGYLFAETRGVMLSEWTYNHVSLRSNDQNPDLGVPP